MKYWMEKMRTIMTLNLDAENIRRLKEMKEKTSVPISRLVDKAIKRMLNEESKN